jgi:hypothetical protein
VSEFVDADRDVVLVAQETPRFGHVDGVEAADVAGAVAALDIGHAETGRHRLDDLAQRRDGFGAFAGRLVAGGEEAAGQAVDLLVCGCSPLRKVFFGDPGRMIGIGRVSGLSRGQTPQAVMVFAASGPDQRFGLNGPAAEYGFPEAELSIVCP